MFNIDVSPLTSCGFCTLLLLLLLLPAVVLAVTVCLAAVLLYKVLAEIGCRIRKATYRAIGSIRKLR